MAATATGAAPDLVEDPVGVSDIGTMLYMKTSAGKWEELVGIRSAPATGSAGGKIEATEMKSKIKQYIAGRLDSPDQDFKFNATAQKYNRVNQLACDGKTHEFLEKYSQGDGTYVKGTAQVWREGTSTESLREATLHITAYEIEDKSIEDVKTMFAGA